MTEEQQRALTEALERALSVSCEARSLGHLLFFQIAGLRDEPGASPEELRDLLSFIWGIPALQIFDQGNQHTLGHIRSIDFYFLVQWLISRGQQVGAEYAVSDLVRYLHAESIEITLVLAVDGFVVQDCVDLGECRLIPWESVTTTEAKWQVQAYGWYGDIPSAAVTQTFTVCRHHCPMWEFTYLMPGLLDPALDCLRCVTAVCGGGFRLLHYWLEPEGWAPWAVTRAALGHDSTSSPGAAALSDEATPGIRNCVSSFRSLSEARRQRLRVPLDRLNRSYLAGTRSVDRAIELGIALESLYAPTKLQKNIVSTICERAHNLLGGTAEEPGEIDLIVRQVYDLRSLAMHSGQFDAKPKWRDEARVAQALERGQRLVGASLVKVIQEGEPGSSLRGRSGYKE